MHARQHDKHYLVYEFEVGQLFLFYTAHLKTDATKPEIQIPLAESLLYLEKVRPKSLWLKLASHMKYPPIYQYFTTQNVYVRNSPLPFKDLLTSPFLRSILSDCSGPTDPHMFQYDITLLGNISQRGDNIPQSEIAPYGDSLQHGNISIAKFPSRMGTSEIVRVTGGGSIVKF